MVNVIRSDADIRSKSTSDVLFGSTATVGFKKPFGIAVDKYGTIYVSDSRQRKVILMNPGTGRVSELVNPYGWGFLTGIGMDNVNGLAGIASGAVVQVFNQDTRRIVATLGERVSMKQVVGVAFDPQRKIIYVTDSRGHKVHAFDYNGRHMRVVASRGSGKGEVFYPAGAAVDSKGRLYVVDAFNWRIQVFNPDGSFNTAFGEHGTAPGTFARPKGIAISSDGLIFVTDAAFDNFQVFDIKGRAYTFVGVPGTRPGMFHQPQHIYVDENDMIYVVDQTNRRVQVFQYLSDKYYQQNPDKRPR